ncbi:hypothetical protein [Streptomyces sp. NPDC004284]|uniref:hypothetical protein n=1 Tax=Streptomyces sp. NPDC004284 TaxID=3364695 RepID=UPI0036863E96
MKFDVFRISTSLAVAALTVTASTGCGVTNPFKPAKPVQMPKAVQHSELVGRWDGEKRCGSPFVRLRDDYTFSAKDFPIAWNGPGPDSKVTRLSADGKWHAVNDDPGLPPYLILRFGNRNDRELLTFTLDQGKLRMNGTVTADGGDSYSYPCHFKRTSTDPGSGR